MEIKDRIKMIMEKENMASGAFAESIGIQQSTLSHILNGRNNPSLDVIMKVHQKYNYVNLEWLLYGHGNMSEETIRQSPRQFSGTTTTDSTQTENIASEDPMIRNETCELVHNYYRINNRQLAQALYNCIQEAARSIIPSESSKN